MVWTSDKLKYLKDNYSTKTAVQLSLDLDIPVEKIYKKASKEKLSTPKQKWTPEQIEYLTKNWEPSRKKEIAETLNKSIAAVSKKASELGLTRKSPPYSQEEIEFLEENWGVLKIGTIAKRLRRSERSIIEKAKKLNLGSTKLSCGKLTKGELASALKVSPAIIDSWFRLGLPFHFRATRSLAKYYLIDIEDFWCWAEKHQEKFDSRKLERGLLGEEPDWMIEKRRADLNRPSNINKKYTQYEEAKIKSLYLANKRTHEIAQQLGRSPTGISNKLKRITW